ncbi:transposase [Martelella sp. FLE1502]
MPTPSTKGATQANMPRGLLRNLRSSPARRPTRKSASSGAGLVPLTRQSSQWRGKAFIQGGRKFLRDALYMPALVAMRFNKQMRAKYEALKDAGKPGRVAVTAIMRKLIELASALIRNDRKWAQNPA